MILPILRKGPEIGFAAALLALFTPGFDAQVAQAIPILLPLLTFLSLVLLPPQSGEARFAWWQPPVLVVWGQGVLPWLLVGALALMGLPRDWLLIALLLNSVSSVYLVTNFAIYLDRRPRLMLALLLTGLCATPLFLFINASLFFRSLVAIDLGGFAVAVGLYLLVPMLAAWLVRRGGVGPSHRPYWQLASLATVALIAFGLEAEVSAALAQAVGAQDAKALLAIARALGFVVMLSLVTFLVSRACLRLVGQDAAGLVALSHAVRNAAMVYVLVQAYLPDSYGLVLGVVQIPIYFAPIALRKIRA